MTRTAGGIVLVAAAVVSGAVLSVEDAPAGAGILSGGTLYPASTWVLVVVLGAAGLALTLRADVAVAGIGAVAGLQLAGTGLVAAKHWRPYMGMAGTYEHLAALQALAIVLAVVGAVATAVGVALLVGGGALPVRSRSPLVVGSAVVVGLALVVGLPLMVGWGDAETVDVSSLGAYALLYAVPWGASVVATGWMTQRPAVVVLLTVLASAVLAALTTPMVDIVFHDVTTALAVAAVATAVVLVVRLLPDRLAGAVPVAGDGR